MRTCIFFFLTTKMPSTVLEIILDITEIKSSFSVAMICIPPYNLYMGRLYNIQ